MKKDGFTLTEIIMAVIVIGILASLAAPRYIRLIEKSRSAEARRVLGVIREAELAYFFEFDTYTSNMTLLRLPEIPSSACNASYYFRYVLSGVSAAGFTGTAMRCSAGGKEPQTAVNYNITINQAGALGGTAGFL